MDGSFTRLLDEAPHSLQSLPTRFDEATMEHLPACIFEAGRHVGLTDKEITQASVKRVREQLRPGLSRS